jgi:hypothetical protein
MLFEEFPMPDLEVGVPIENPNKFVPVPLIHALGSQPCNRLHQHLRGKRRGFSYPHQSSGQDLDRPPAAFDFKRALTLPIITPRRGRIPIGIP